MSEKKKVISVMIPTYNEEENARPIYEAVRDEIRKDCPDYDYEILFIDNKSQDRTRRIITDICAQDPKVKAIFNSKNFGQFNSPYYGMIHTTGDCTIPGKPCHVLFAGLLLQNHQKDEQCGNDRAVYRVWPVR